MLNAVLLSGGIGRKIQKNLSFTMDSTVAVIVFMVFIISYYILRKPKNLPPGPFSIPFIGSISLMRKFPKKRPHLTLFEEAQKYGDVMGFRMGSQLIVVVSGYEMVHEALVKQADVFSDRPTELPTFKQLFKDTKDDNGRGILFNNYGNSWRRLRRFTLQALRDFGVGKTSIEDKILTEVDAVTNEFLGSKGTPVNIGLLMQKLVGNVIYGIVFGRRYDYDDPDSDKICRLTNIAFSGSGPVSMDNYLPRWFLKIINPLDMKNNTARDAVFNSIREFIIAQIDEHEMTYDAGNIRDFTDIYIKTVRGASGDEWKTFTKEDMFRVIMDLFLAGSETTSQNLDWVFLFLAEYPDVQEKCQREIQEVVGNRPVQYADRSRLPYVEATVMEIQRLANIVPISVDHCTTADTTLGGFFIPKRTIVLPFIYSVTMDPRHWQKPSEFHPERFLDPAGNLVRNDAFIPFSAGPRQCVGESLAKMELFLVTSNLIQRFNFWRENETVRHSFRSQENMITNAPLPYCLRVFPRV